MLFGSPSKYEIWIPTMYIYASNLAKSSRTQRYFYHHGLKATPFPPPLSCQCYIHTGIYTILSSHYKCLRPKNSNLWQVIISLTIIVLKPPLPLSLIFFLFCELMLSSVYFSMAVDSYNKWTTGSHLIFKEVWAASSAPFYFPVGDHLMNYILRLTAIKCSQSGALGNYSGQVLEKEQGGVFTYSFGIFQELVS